MTKKLTDATIASELQQLNRGSDDTVGWQRKGNAIVRSFYFDNFTSGLAWMTRVARCAEELNHHPHWCHSYNSVVVTLTTHDIGAISRRDFSLAQTMNHYYLTRAASN